MSDAVCRGCWQLGNNCGECSRCLATAKDGVKEIRELRIAYATLAKSNLDMTDSMLSQNSRVATITRARDEALATVSYLRGLMLRMFDRNENWSAVDMRAAIADALRTTVQELEDRDE